MAELHPKATVVQKLLRYEINHPKFGVLMATIARGASLALALLAVPILLQLLALEDYSTWVVLYSIVGWLTYFDFGVGYALRNGVSRITTDTERSEFNERLNSIWAFQVLVSALLLFMLVPVCIFVEPFRSNVFESLLIYVPAILLLPLGAQTSVLQGMRLTGLQGLIGLIRQLWLLVVFGSSILSVTWRTSGLAVVLGLFSVVSALAVFLIVQARFPLRFKLLLSWKGLHRASTYIKVGAKFFLLQVTSLILFSLGNYISFLLFGPLEVATYDALNKVYTSTLSIFNIVVSVYWGHLSKSLAEGDSANLRKWRRAVDGFLVLFCMLQLGSVLLVPPFITIWTHGKLNATVLEILPFAALGIVQAIAYRGAMILNIFERVSGQIVLALGSICLFVLFVQVGCIFQTLKTPALIPLSSALAVIPSVIIYNMWAEKLVKKALVIPK